ncbi:MAG TPA: hypothetical protein VM661_17140 [Candidatus Sulfotelmatobacter sp.]|jgi:hypothetical protein|nr:hypothetical protein [Candidatus Sulfotelmatobacter sp.]
MGLFKHCRHGHGACEPTTRCGRILHFGGHILLGIVVVAVVAVVFGWVVMTAWNAVVPAVFNLPLITFWQAVGLMILGRVLFGRFHHRHRGHGKCRVGRHFRRPEADAPPEGGAFAQWWWEEGETAFRAFQARKASSERPTAE